MVYNNHNWRWRFLRIAQVILVIVLLMINVASAISNGGGRIVVFADDWPNSDSHYDASDRNFTINVFDWLTKSKPAAKILVDDQFDKYVIYNQMLNELTAKGYTVVRANTTTWAKTNLASYDAVLIELGVVDSTVLTDYVNAGKSVYVVGGNDISPDLYNSFLANFDMSLLYPPVIGPYTLTNFEIHPITQGVTQLYTGGPTPIILASGRPKILSTAREINWLATFETPIGYINGTVLNNSNGIAGAIVTTNTGIKATTNASGFYSMILTSGEYNLTAVNEPRFYVNNSITANVVAGYTTMQDIELLKKQTGNISGTATKA